MQSIGNGSYGGALEDRALAAAGRSAPATTTAEANDAATTDEASEGNYAARAVLTNHQPQGG